MFYFFRQNNHFLTFLRTSLYQTPTNYIFSDSARWDLWIDFLSNQSQDFPSTFHRNVSHPKLAATSWSSCATWPRSREAMQPPGTKDWAPPRTSATAARRRTWSTAWRAGARSRRCAGADAMWGEGRSERWRPLWWGLCPGKSGARCWRARGRPAQRWRCWGEGGSGSGLGRARRRIRGGPCRPLPSPQTQAPLMFERMNEQMISLCVWLSSLIVYYMACSFFLLDHFSFFFLNQNRSANII